MDVQCGWGFFLFFLSGIFPVVWREDVWFFCNFFRKYGNFAGVLLRFWGVFAQFLQTFCVRMHNVYQCRMCVLCKILRIFLSTLFQFGDILSWCSVKLCNSVMLRNFFLQFLSFYHCHWSVVFFTLRPYVSQTFATTYEKSADVPTT